MMVLLDCRFTHLFPNHGVGIAVCLSTLFSYMYFHSVIDQAIPQPSFQYIFSICSLLFLEVAVIVTTFFKYDWSSLIAKYIDESHEDFKSFIIFHEKMCQLIALMILVPQQVSVIALAIILWTVGIERMAQTRHWEIPDFTRSFLVGTGSGILVNTRLNCSRCEVLRTGHPRQSLLAYVESVFRMQSQRTPIVC
ncbi:PREDICTED: uncharacterized protein LOC108663434 isoform X5 [Theobroma cacao]|uniref:Uncharacterized protein LOC108663434 isoform X5 n=1 Tax=Theobroma cacao TaxID=3641 RepID=A0AB32WSD0_THECC|nr:PREDICTED: uncharacterized protein LOC108663434 isoform X5 [Theobroma cacao]